MPVSVNEKIKVKFSRHRPGVALLFYDRGTRKW